jgi:hypothetical protein
MSPQKLTLPKPIEAKKLKLKGTDGKDSKKNKDDNINELKNLLKKEIVEAVEKKKTSGSS